MSTFLGNETWDLGGYIVRNPDGKNGDPCKVEMKDGRIAYGVDETEALKNAMAMPKPDSAAEIRTLIATVAPSVKDQLEALTDEQVLKLRDWIADGTAKHIKEAAAKVRSIRPNLPIEKMA